jgi:hypothetical protein
MLPHGRIFEPLSIEEVDMAKRSCKRSTEELTYGHHDERQREPEEDE